MEAKRCVELIEEHDKCIKCDNRDLSVEVHGKVFKRTCKCGWKIEIKED